MRTSCVRMRVRAFAFVCVRARVCVSVRTGASWGVGVRRRRERKRACARARLRGRVCVCICVCRRWLAAAFKLSNHDCLVTASQATPQGRARARNPFDAEALVGHVRLEVVGSRPPSCGHRRRLSAPTRSPAGWNAAVAFAGRALRLCKGCNHVNRTTTRTGQF